MSRKKGLKTNKYNLPLAFKNYFWDVDINKLDPKKHPKFVIERILEWGDQEGVKWMFKHFSRGKVKNVLKESNTLSQKSAAFWSIYLNVQRRQVLCLSKRFQNIHRRIWPY